MEHVYNAELQLQWILLPLRPKWSGLKAQQCCLGCFRCEHDSTYLLPPQLIMAELSSVPESYTCSPAVDKDISYKQVVLEQHQHGRCVIQSGHIHNVYRLVSFSLLHAATCSIWVWFGWLEYVDISNQQGTGWIRGAGAGSLGGRLLTVSENLRWLCGGCVVV